MRSDQFVCILIGVLIGSYLAKKTKLPIVGGK